MLPDRVSNPGPLTYESDALPIALPGPAYNVVIHPNDAMTGLNNLRKIICLRKSEVSVERISVCNVTENLLGHAIHCLPCSYTNDFTNCYRNNYDVILMSKSCDCVNVLSRYWTTHTSL